MIKHISITVRGKVQGVFYRASTKAKADGLRISGFVRNKSDGSVYIEAEGEEAKLNELIAWCKQGPIQSQVQHCDVAEGPVEGFLGFFIQR